jgi:PAS domain S-box-containing protein
MNAYEQAPQKSEQRLQDTLDTIKDGFFSFDRDWRVTYANQAASHVNHRVHELLGQIIWEVESGLAGSNLETVYRRVMERGEPEEVEYHNQRSSRWFLLRVSPWTDGIAVYSKDITETKQAEQARERLLVELLRQKNLLQGVLENSPLAIAVTQGPEHRFLMVNAAQKRLFPNIPEFTGRTVAEIWPEQKETFAPILDRVYHAGDPFFAEDAPWQTDKGSGLEEAFYTYSYSPLYGPDGTVEGIIVLSIETTEQVRTRWKLESELEERKRVQAALQESEGRFRAMADGTPVIIWVTDPEGQIEFINQAYADFFGVTLDEVKSGSWTMLVHPDDSAAHVDRFVECIRERKPFRGEARVRRHDGQWRWIDSIGQPRFSISGELLGMAGSSIDITDRKRAERDLRHYAEELERSNEALRDFASIASHDLQEPLRKVRAFGHLLENYYGQQLGPDGQDYIARISSAGERMSEMLHGLLAYSSITTQSEPFIEVNLRKIAEQVLTDLEIRIQETRARVELGELPVVQGDPLQLRQLLQNLISNGIKYHRPETAPHIVVSCRQEGADRVQISVQDNGIGIEMKDSHRIFHPFVRLHGRSEYEGTGMGLAICQKVVERHGGSIHVESTPGSGSTFTVTLRKSSL